MEITEAIKTTYENMGFAVMDVIPIEGTPFFEMEFINAEGHFKKPIITFFMIAHEPNKRQEQASA